MHIAAIALWTMVLLIVCIRIARLYPQHDVFVTYVSAGRKWMESQALYSTTRGFVYSPLVAACFAPFSWFPGWIGAIVWRLLNAATFCWAVSWWLKVGLPPEIPRTAYPLVFLLLLPLALGNINNGQVNPAIIGLLMVAILAAHLKRWTLSAVCIGISAYLKIYPLSVGLLLVLIFPRQLSWRLALVLIVFAALPFLLQQPAYVQEQYQRWFSTRAADDRRMNMDIAPRDLAMVLKLVHIHLSSHAFMFLQVLAGAALAALCAFGRWFRRWSDERVLTCIFALGSCWMLLFGPATESATYVMLAPALVLTLVQAFYQPTPSWMRFLLSASYAVLLSGLMIDSFAKLRKSVYVMSVQPSATLLFAAGAVIWILVSSRWERHRGERAALDT
ncbi:MAG: DUF2029 domain-containing protein [Verrucomicrobia bacterium]|nr:DUF2029 domain-containing protein [Verrucomicrobiota bacterium]